MKKIEMYLKDCYGISELKEIFDFSKKPACLIYAPNGMMKTSFTKTLKNIQDGEEPQENVSHRPSQYEIIVESQNGEKSKIQKEQIFVIESYQQDYTSTHMSALLVNMQMRKEYDSLVAKIVTMKKAFLQQLELYTGSKISPEEEIKKTFNKDNIFDVLQELKDDEKECSYGLSWQDKVYPILFNEKVEKFLQDEKNITLLEDFKKQYEKLMEHTSFLKKGEFSCHNAKEVEDSLEKNGFFSANHKVKLRDETFITTAGELSRLIEKEKLEVFQNPKIRSSFDKIEKSLEKSQALKEFRSLLEKNLDIIPEIINMPEFKANVWKYILKQEREKIHSLLEVYQPAKERIESIQEQAAREVERWRKIVEIFKKRFNPPFEVSIQNQKDVVLNSSVPVLQFEYQDQQHSVPVNRETLNQVLSTGEQRSLYLMNIIFDLEGLKESGQEFLIVADDIAESFDYRNKYAIIEYLVEQSKNPNYKMIVLTHNFDFYRTLGRRMLGKTGNYARMASRVKGKIVLQKGGYFNDVFSYWKNNVKKNEKIFLAAIPFVRNLIEYKDSQENDNYKKLTSALHVKEGKDVIQTRDIKKQDVEEIFAEVWGVELDLAKEEKEKIVEDVLMVQAEKLYEAEDDGEINLESRIVLSMAIRMKAEHFMLKELEKKEEGKNEIRKLKKNSCQTGALIGAYAEIFPESFECIKILNEVSLMVSENIHLNSFMYEPIIDISLEQLKKLWKQVTEDLYNKDTNLEESLVQGESAVAAMAKKSDALL